MSFTNFCFTKRSFLQHDGLPFADMLPEETIARIHRDADLPTPDEQASHSAPPFALARLPLGGGIGL